jgi:enamine deaminase RidA (YjgF/YER057c/UK114 family)
MLRNRWFITDRMAYQASQRAIGEAYAEIIGKHYPAMSIVVVDGLLEDGAKVEIEATAVVPEWHWCVLKGSSSLG